MSSLSDLRPLDSDQPSPSEWSPKGVLRAAGVTTKSALPMFDATTVVNSTHHHPRNVTATSLKGKLSIYGIQRCPSPRRSDLLSTGSPAQASPLPRSSRRKLSPVLLPLSLCLTQYHLLLLCWLGHLWPISIVPQPTLTHISRSTNATRNFLTRLLWLSYNLGAPSCVTEDCARFSG